MAERVCRAVAGKLCAVVSCGVVSLVCRCVCGHLSQAAGCYGVLLLLVGGSGVALAHSVTCAYLHSVWCSVHSVAVCGTSWPTCLGTWSCALDVAGVMTA